MVERESPIGPAYQPGRHGNAAQSAGVRLSETRPGSIVQIMAWPGAEKSALVAIKKATTLTLPDRPGGGVSKAGKAAFCIGPGRWLVADQAEGLAATLSSAIGGDVGAVTDLSHGRTAIRVSGDRAGWVLAKFFALDFAAEAFALGDGRSTAHHDIFAQIQRTGADQFDVYVFRSFARAFWTSLRHACEEVGYEIA